ncbi:hypothetical protein SPYCA_0556 [Sphingopyxis sp. FD7]|jgi:hypothetical protein|nr:hypothetical protein SPYCA_0556 [Sphingopyxis sp. FD7]
MLSHSDRRSTLRWAKIAPPPAVASGSPSDFVALLVRATSPASTALLAEKLPDAIPADQIVGTPL